MCSVCLCGWMTGGGEGQEFSGQETILTQQCLSGGSCNPVPELQPPLATIQLLQCQWPCLPRCGCALWWLLGGQQPCTHSMGFGHLGENQPGSKPSGTTLRPYPQDLVLRIPDSSETSDLFKHPSPKVQSLQIHNFYLYPHPCRPLPQCLEGSCPW